MPVVNIVGPFFYAAGLFMTRNIYEKVGFYITIFKRVTGFIYRCVKSVLQNLHSEEIYFGTLSETLMIFTQLEFEFFYVSMFSLPIFSIMFLYSRI